MVRLRCESFWEKLLIAAFVFFFQKLYPFAWVNDRDRPIAAAAGGCLLIRRQVLDSMGGLQKVRHALIDDCALAEAVKSSDRPQPFQGIWLGLSDSTYSLRPYPSLDRIWDMVARTAFTQLNYSPFLLVGTVIGMILIDLVPPLSFLIGLLLGSRLIVTLSLCTWSMMAIAYFPTLRLYQRSFA